MKPDSHACGTKYSANQANQHDICGKQTVSGDNLPELVRRAARSLADAQSSAEVLDARDQSMATYDAAKMAARMARRQGAHDDLVARCHRAQADALIIRSQAEIRLADEYDAAQERGDAAGPSTGRPKSVADDNAYSAADLGLRRDEIHDARKLRDAERDNPGLAERALNEMVEARQEPTRAELRRSVLAAVDDAARPSRGPSRRNPEWEPNPESDAVLTFIDACETLSKADPDAMAAWDRREVTRQRMLANARTAHGVLSTFMEASEC